MKQQPIMKSIFDLNSGTQASRKSKINEFFEAIKDNDILHINSMIESDITIIDEENISGRNPLPYAISKKRYLVAQILINAGADVNAVSVRGISILQQSLRMQSSKVLRCILNRKDLIVGGNYEINPILIKKHDSLFQLILRSAKPLKELVTKETFQELISCPEFTQSLHYKIEKYCRINGYSDIMRIILLELEEPFSRDGIQIRYMEVEDKLEDSTLQLEEGSEEAILESKAIYAQGCAHLITSISELGYIVQEVLGDGNCFFSAVAANIGYIFGISAEAADLRNIAIEYMLAHPRSYVEFFENREALYWYIDMMSMSGEEADGVIIHALADALGRVIVVHGDGYSYNVLPRGGNISAEIHLLYDGRHYDALLPSEEMLIGLTVDEWGFLNERLLALEGPEIEAFGLVSNSL